MRTLYFRALWGRVRRALATGWPLAAAAALTLLLILPARAQQPGAGFFSDNAGARQAAATSDLAAALRASRPLTLDVPGMRAALATAPPEQRAAAAPLLLTLPLPDGRNAQFRVREASILEPALAAKYPDIKTYVGIGVDDPTATVRLDFTPRGFHAQVLSATTGDFFIDPASRADVQHYLSFWKRDMQKKPFDCGTQGSLTLPAQKPGQAQVQRTSGPVLRTFRLALAATGEYTAFQGGTVPAAFAGMVTTVNRVVGVYEKELDVRLVLVANTTQLIYTNAATDPYTNNDGATLLGENQTNVTNIIGAANYDIGHVFSTGGGGIAGLGVVCRDAQKARGVTGSPSPVGDAFDIDYVAHEMGHQFGGNHTFNSATGSCGGGNRSAAHAYEPGSGSTIMAYAGICAADDLQPNSDAYFHVESYEEIQTYLGTVSCGTSASTGNTPPTVAALPASGKVLPIGTPFKLTASGTDADGDALTYNWEEYDLGPASTLTAAQVAGQAIPLFRSFYPTASPTRYFPRLSNLVANTFAVGERLPTVSRPLKFRVTLRDQHAGSQGVVGGLNSSDVVSLTTTSAAGPFVVTAPNTAVTLTGGTSQAVSWNVAGTNANGVNCATVNIRLSTDGGLTYPTLLLAGTPNDGSEAVTLPSVATTTARIMVEAADNYFFDISNTNFTISTSATACAAPTNVSVSNITGTTASVSFTGTGATSYVVTTSPASATQTITGTTATLSGLTAGTNYVVYIVSNCAGGATSAAASAPFGTVAPPPCNAPTNLVATVSGTTATITFTPGSPVTSYTVTTSPATTTQTATTSPITLTGLALGVSYTVNIVSNCVAGGTSTSTVALTTVPGNDECTAAVTLTPGATCVSTTGSVTGATQSQPASLCSGAVSSSARDVWYSFVATSSRHTITATSSSFDGVLEVFTGSCGALSTLSCADNVAAGSEVLAFTTLTPGTRYYVRFYPYTDASEVVTGTFTICVTSPAAPPANDECAGAISLTSGTSCSGTTGTIAGATQSLAPSSCSGFTSTTARDVWYSFVATGSTHTIQTTGTFDGVLQAFSGSCGALTALGCVDAVGNSETLTFTTLTAGTRYYVRYYPYSSGTTTGTFSICVTNPAPVAVLQLLYQTGDLGQPTDNVVRSYLELRNTGTAPATLGQVTMRYWLTIENFATPEPRIDWAKLGTTLVSVRYVALATPRQGAYGYLEYAFASGAGTLDPGASTGPIYSSMHKQNWTPLDETNDYSYLATGTFAANPRITVYVNGTLAAGTEPAAVAASTALKVYAGNQDIAPTTSAISVYLQVGNTGNTPVSYPDLKVRYWFTPDGTQPLVYPVDYAVLGSSNFSLQTGLKNGETYAELSFASALGTLYPGSNTDNIQFKIRKDNWSSLIQTNDYSFRPSAAIEEQPRITAYLGGQLVWGTEPTGTPAATSPAARELAKGTLDNPFAGSPNPFTSELRLRFTLARAEEYTLTVYDAQGRLVEELPGGTAVAGQPQELTWQASRHAAGLYLVRLRSNSTLQYLRFVKQ